MKTNKKLKLNTKKVIILSDEQQNSVQGGIGQLTLKGCEVSVKGCNVSVYPCLQTIQCPTIICYSQVPPPPPYSCV